MAENILLYSAEKDFQEENPANGFCFIDTMEERWVGETESSKQLQESADICFTTDSCQEDFKLKTIKLLRYGVVLNVNETENSARYKAGELILLSGLDEYNSYVSHVITAYSSFTETFHDSETHTGVTSGITFFLDGVSSGAVSAITYRSDTFGESRYSEFKWLNYIEVYDTDENFIGVLVKLPGKEDLIANNFIDGINTYFNGGKLIERETGIAATPTDSGYLITHINFFDMSSCGFTVSDGEYFGVVPERDVETGTISRAFKKFYTEGETGSTHYSNTSFNQVINSEYEIFYEVGDETKSPYYFTTYWYDRMNSIQNYEGRGAASGVYKKIQSDATYGTQLTNDVTDSFLYITESDFGKSKFVTKAIPGVSYVLESGRVAYNWSGEIDNYDIEIRISSSSDYEITTDLTCADFFSTSADTAMTYSILFIDENSGNETELEARYVYNNWYICYSGLRKDNVRVFLYNGGTFRFKCDGAGNIILQFAGPA